MNDEPAPELFEAIKALKTSILNQPFSKVTWFIQDDVLYKRCGKCGGVWKPCDECDSTGWTARAINPEDAFTL